MNTHPRLSTLIAALAMFALAASPLADAKGSGSGGGRSGGASSASRGAPNHSNARPNVRPQATTPPRAAPKAQALRKHFADRAQRAQDGKKGSDAPPGSRSAGKQRSVRERVGNALQGKGK